MNRTLRCQWIAVSVVLAIAPIVSFDAAAAVGMTPATYDVSPSGDLTYSVPIRATDGIGGMSPQLSLHSTGTGHRGIVGVGFTVAGLSDIRPCGKTMTQDGTSAGYAYCIDGARLRLVSGTYGGSGAVYRTEIDQLARVTSYDTAYGYPGWFKVETRDGLIYEYGHTTDARPMTSTSTWAPPIMWAVSKVSDRAGNSITYHYDTVTTSKRFRPSYIHYTHSSYAGTGHYKIGFVYQAAARPDIVDRAFPSAPGNGRLVDDRLLERIELKHDDVIYRQYLLGYETGAGNNSRLRTITECAASTYDCLAPTTLGWQTATNGHAAATAVTIVGAQLPLDINGDGSEDVVYPSGGTWRYRMGGPSGYGVEVNTGVAVVNAPKAMPLHWDGDDRTDLLIDWSDGKWRVLKGTATGFASPVHAGPGTGVPSNTANSAWRIADVNGDGLDDLLRATANSYARIFARYNNGSSGFGSEAYVFGDQYYRFQSSPFPSMSDYGSSSVRQADFNGDGMTDLTVYACEWDAEMGYCITTGWYLLLANGSGYTLYWNLPGATLAVSPRLGDFNGDGLTDVVYPRQTPATWCYGYGQSESGLTYSCGLSTSGLSIATFLTADYDADGYDDVYVSRTATTLWEVIRSAGPSMASGTVGTGLSSSGAAWASTDWSGDGLDDLVRSGGVAHLHLGVPGDLLASATDGFGNTITATYYPMSNAAVYTRGAGAVYPVMDVQWSRPLLHTLQHAPAGGPAYSFEYQYAGGRAHTQGRGFLGMGSRTVKDGRNNVVTTETYRQDFPFIGAVASVAVNQPAPGSQVIETVSHSYQKHDLEVTTNNQRYLPYRSLSVSTRREVGGPKNDNPITQATTAYTVNTLGNTTNVTTTVLDQDTGSDWYGQTFVSAIGLTYSEDQTNWCLAVPTTRVETRTLPDATSQTRRTHWTVPVSALCRATHEVVEPYEASDKSLTTEFYYDSCGNDWIVNTYPSGLPAQGRTWVYNHGSRCQYPTNIMNPLTQGATIAYDYALGVPTSQTDPNGLTVTTDYDTFGRPTRVQRPDGTATRYTLGVCNAGNGYCGDANLRYSLTESARNTADSQIWYAHRYFDGLGRVRYDQPLTLDGALAVTRTNYDAFGRVSQRSRPYFSGGSVYWVNYSYDLVGRLTQENAPIGEAQTSGRITSYAYEGRDLQLTDPRGYTTTRAADVMGRLRKVVDPSPGGTTLYAYKPFGELASITDAAGNVSSWSYNIRGFTTATSDPDSGSWTYTPNAFGELVTQVNAKSQTTTFTYDKLGRPLTRVEAEGTTTFTWGTSAASKNIGRLASVASPGSYSESYLYDSLGRPSQQTVVADGSNYVINRGYSAATGQPSSLTYPTSVGTYRLTLGYEYQNGLLKRIRDAGSGGTEVFWELTSTDAFGHIQNESLGNGVITYTEFDQAAGFMTLRQAGVGGGTGLIHATASWDLNYNLQQRQDLKQSATETFTYDSLNRLDYSTLYTPGTGTITNQDLTYNAIGNILWKQDVGSYSYHATKKRAVVTAGSNTYGYDANGNMTSRNGSSIGYTSYDLPNVISAGSNSSTLSYGAFRNRFKQVAVTAGVSETTIYVGGILERVTKSGTTTWRHKVQGPSGVVAIVNCTGSSCNPTATTNYIHSDHLGSGELITNSSGTEVVKLSFGAFGERRDRDWNGSISGADLTAIGNTTRLGFTGHEHLDAVGLIHMNGRVYDPVVGRFLSVDPIVHVGLSQSPNSYSYVWNNPLSLTDPSGFNPWRDPDGDDDDGGTHPGFPGFDFFLDFFDRNGPSDNWQDDPADRFTPRDRENDRAPPGADEPQQQTAVRERPSTTRMDQPIGALLARNQGVGPDRLDDPFSTAGCAISPDACLAGMPYVLADLGMITEAQRDALIREQTAAAMEVGIAAATGGPIAGWLAQRALLRLLGVGAARTAVNANKLNHIFGNASHRLDDLVRASGGSSEAAYRAVQQAANQALREGRLVAGPNGILPGGRAGAVLNVNGVNVQLVGGRVVNGEVQIGSFSRRFLGE